MASVSAIVLTAGLSSRMKGKQKLFLPYRNKSILEHVISELLKSQATEVIVVSSPLTHEKIKTLPTACLSADRGITLVTNPDHEQGMTTTIQKGVQAADQNKDGFMICLGDMPRITTEEYDQLMSDFSNANEKDEKAIVLPFYKKQIGNPVILSSHYRTKILSHQEMEGCRGIVQANLSHLVKVEMSNDHVLVDVDTPRDYEELSNSQY